MFQRPAVNSEIDIGNSSAMRLPAMTQSVQPQIDGIAIARSSSLNLLGQVLPLALGIWILPFLLNRLGPERFALLSYTFILYGNMSLFELGLGRALTKRTAEFLSLGETDNVRTTLWTCVALQVMFGIVAGGVMASTCSVWLKFFTKDSVALFQEARLTVFVAAGFLPFALPSLALRGTLEALQRFDLVNVVRGPQLSAFFLLPAVVCLFHGSLAWVVAALCSTWVLASVAYLVILKRILPTLFAGPRICGATARQLLGFGGWVTVSSALTPIFTHFERFALGFFGTLAAVSTYALPADALQRLAVMPQSLSSTLFPAFSALEASGKEEERSRLYGSSLKMLFALTGIPILVFVLFAHEILRLWLGRNLSASAVIAAQIIAMSVLVNCLTYLPLNLLHGLGRPDLTAKIHLAEALPYMLVCVALVVRYGVIGAAIGLFIRVAVDAALQFWFVYRLGLSSLRAMEFAAMLCLMLVPAVAIPFTSLAAWTPYYAIVLALAFCLACWRLVLDEAERMTLISIGSRIIRRESPPGYSVQTSHAD